MRALLALLPALLAACAGTAPTDAPAPADPFDARAWMARSAAVWDSTAWQSDYDAARLRSKEAALELNTALGLAGACEVSDEEARSPDHPWGAMSRTVLGPDESLIMVSCRDFAYQSSFVFVHVAGTQAALVSVDHYTLEGERYSTSPLLVGYEGVDVARRCFGVFSKGRGFADCGTYSVYRLGAVGEPAATVEVRGRACTDEGPEGEDLLDPADWPLVYPAP